MKTRDRDNKSVNGLPPPPAPPARDANPWTVSSDGLSDAGRRPGAPPGAPVDLLSRTTGQKRLRARPLPNPKPRRPPVVPITILAIMMLAPIVAALRGLGAGSLAELIGPLVVLVFVGLIAFRIMRSRQR